MQKVKVDVFDSSAAWLQQAKISAVADGCMFTEGPVWHPSNYFIFSDTPANKIYRLTDSGSLEIFLDKSGLSHSDTGLLSDQVGSNGLAFDKQHNLLVCQHGNHAIALLDGEQTIHPLVTSFNGKPFNSPNDIISSANGVVFFTDPPYGLAGQELHPQHFQPLAGIYRYDEHDGIRLVGDQLRYPNGLFFSPDQQYLFVSSNHPDEPFILRYHLLTNGGVEYDGIFMQQNADGMTTDESGNIYLATNEGVLVVSSSAKKLALVSLAETPTNLAWGGNDRQTLLVTARSMVYTIEKP